MQLKALRKVCYRNLLLILILVFTLVTTACSNDKSKSNGTSGSDSREIVHLRYMLWVPDQKIGYQKSIDEFEKLHPNIKVTIEQYEWGQYWQKLLTQLAAGTAPDVFTNQLAYFAQFVKRDQILEITPMVKRDKVDLSIYYPQLLDAYTIQDKIYGLPKDWDTITIFYNKDLFKQYNVTEPTNLTWNPKDGGSFLKLAQQLTVDNNGKHPTEVGFNPNNIKQYGFLSQNSDQTQYWNFIAMNGGKLIDKNYGNKMLLDSPESIEALQFLVDLMYKYHVSPPGSSITAPNASDQLFASGKVAMLTDGSWNIKSRFESAKFQLGIAPLPEGPKGRISVMNGLADAIYKNTKHPKESWELVKWLAGERSQEIMASSGLVWPGTPKQAPLFSKFWKDKGLDVQPFLDEANGQTIGYPITEKWNQAGTEISKQFGLLWLNQLSAEEAAKTATERANAALSGK